MDVWKPFGIEPDQCVETQIGPLKIWLRRVDDETHVAVGRDASPDGTFLVNAPEPVKDTVSGGLDWSRWVCGTDWKTVKLIPKTPDRPVVVRPEVPVNLPPKQKAIFFVRVPCWVAVTVGEPDPRLLCEEPSLVLSNTWFGDPTSGDLCYSMRTRARRHNVDTQIEPHRIVCPVTISNVAKKGVDITRLCVHVEHLNIYLGETRLWTNGVSITFKGENEVSQVAYSRDVPEYEPAAEMLSKARKPLKKPLLKRSLGDFNWLGGD